MFNTMGRREFLKLSGATAIALTTVGLGVVEAKNKASYWLYGFDDEEKALLRKAVNIAVNRIQEERIWKKAYSTATRHLLSDEVMDNSNLIDSRKNRWNLLWHQLYYLSRPNGSDDTGPAFPNIRIHGGYAERGNWLGRASTDRVIIRQSNKRIRQSGEFNITLNRYYLGSGKIYSNPEEWASTIAHEMLHNLGHLHPTGENALSETYQINALNNAILGNGYNDKPRFKAQASGIRCG